MSTADPNQKERSLDVDFVKGVGIIGIVCLHVMWDDMLSNPFGHFVLLFMVPVFFYISGYLSSKKHGPVKGSGKPFYKKVCHLLVALGMPYYIFCLLTTIFAYCLFLMHWQDFSINSYVLPAILFLGIGPLWFLPPMLFGKIIFAKTETLPKMYPVGIAALLFLILFFALQERIYALFDRVHFNRTLIYCLIHSIFAFYLMISGYYFGLLEEKCTKSKLGYFCLTVGLSVVTAAILPLEANHISIVHLCIPNLLYLPFVALLCSLILLVSKLLFKIPYSQYVLSPVCYCGRVSLFIMLFHQDFLLPVFKHFHGDGNKKVETLIVIVICAVLAPLVERVFPLCLGKGENAKKLEQNLTAFCERIFHLNK